MSAARRRAAWTLPLALLLGACVPAVNITRDTRLSGSVVAKSFRVAPGVVVSVEEDLTVQSRGPVMIEGAIRGAIGSGANIVIRVSSGDCVIAGEISAGSGADGEDPGEDGDDGGAVRLRADRGAVRVAAALSGGAGGDGAGDRVQGGGDARAVSGAGGPGGDVEIVGRSVELDGSAAAGDGGAGGAAFAQVLALAPGAPDVVDRGESLADEEEDGVEDLPMPAAGTATAVARSGGRGGSIVIQAVDPAGRVALAPAASLRAGAGGPTLRASARGGKAADAALEKPGDGGNIALLGPTAAPAGPELLPGAGGDAGAIGALSGAAQAHETAAARTSGGGAPGKVFLGVATADEGVGGDNCNVRALTDLDVRYEFGDLGTKGAGGGGDVLGAPVADMEISFTRYRIYRECAWKYKLIFVDGRRIPLNPKSSYGLSLHRALETWLSSGDDSIEALFEALHSRWLAEGYPDEATEARWYAKAERTLARFHGEESSRRARTIGVEKEFVWTLGRHDVRGMIDRIDQGPDGAYELIDYKTGPEAPTAAQVAADPQLRFYALGARRGLGLRAATLTVDCVTAGARVSAPCDPSGEERLAADIAAAATSIEAAKFGPDTSFCPRCDFKNDCAHSALRARK